MIFELLPPAQYNLIGPHRYISNVVHFKGLLQPVDIVEHRINQILHKFNAIFIALKKNLLVFFVQRLQSVFVKDSLSRS